MVTERPAPRCRLSKSEDPSDSGASTSEASRISLSTASALMASPPKTSSGWAPTTKSSPLETTVLEDPKISGSPDRKNLLRSGLLGNLSSRSCPVEAQGRREVDGRRAQAGPYEDAVRNWYMFCHCEPDARTLPRGVADGYRRKATEM